jgi:hypothetical protein
LQPTARNTVAQRLRGLQNEAAGDVCFDGSSFWLIADDSRRVSEGLCAMRPKKSALLPGQVAKSLKWIGAGSATAIVVISFVVWFTWPAGTTTTNFLQDVNFYEITPPSKLSGPGSLNTVEFLDNGKIVLHPTCEIGPASDLLANKIQESETSEREVSQLLKKKFDVSEKIRDLLTSDVARKQTKSISLHFQNARILLISDEVMLSVRHALLGTTCDEAVGWNIANGGMVCQAKSVLEADVVYEIKYEDNVSATDQARFNSEAAAKLDLVASQDSTNRISGKRLFYGVRLAPDAVFPNTPDSKPVKCLRL